jgi:two-component system, NarL family, sensor histidine kinase DesK
MMVVTLGGAPDSSLSCRHCRFVLTVRRMVTGVQGAVMGKRWRVAAVDGDEPVALVVRLGIAGVVLWNLGQVGRLAYLALTDIPQTIWWQAGALALALPADIVLIIAAIRNVRPRLSGWLLAAVALPVVAVAPLGGYDWALMLTMPAALALIYFRPPVNVAAFVLVVGFAPVSVALLSKHPDASSPLPGWHDKVQYGAYETMDVMWAAAALAVLVWLTRTVRELDAARRELAANAVIIERQRIDDEVARTLGTALEGIVARGELAQALAESAPDLSARELEALTARSRDTLAQARAMLSGYRDVSAEAELRAAVTLLSAAGIRASLSLDCPEELPAELPETVHTALRETVARALEDHGLRECVLTATTADGELVIGLSRPGDPACRKDAA